MRVAGAAVVLACFSAAWSQEQAPPEFETVAFRALGPQRTGGLLTTSADPSMMRYANVPLKLLIAVAYRLDVRLIRGGPDWFDRQFYDLEAKIPPGVPRSAVPTMLQSLLKARVKLEAHWETEAQTAYLLEVSEGGLRMEKASPGDEKKVAEIQSGRDRAPSEWSGMTAQGLDMKALARLLAQVTGTEVTDRTGLAGWFNFKLQWKPVGSKGLTPSLRGAVEKLGLKFEQEERKVETLVIDHVERTPAEK